MCLKYHLSLIMIKLKFSQEWQWITCHHTISQQGANYDEKYMNMVMDHIIYITKPDFLKWVRDNNVGECIFLIDEVMEDLKYSYREFKKIYPKLGIK